MKLCAIEPKELEEKILTRFAENQNDELLEDLSDYVINSQKEIERLENLNKQVVEECQKLDDEVLRLNNIINELDDMFYETFRISQNGYYSISEWELKEFTDKIKELKGSEKSEAVE